MLNIMPIYARWLLILFAAASAQSAATADSPTQELPPMSSVPLHTVYRRELTSQQEYDNPLWDVALTFTFHSPTGREVTIDGYWDGGKTYRAAFCPDEAGTWTWTSSCEPADAGLHGQSGSFDCVPYPGNNPVFREGPVEVSKTGQYFVQASGKPMFWLADTAWNGVLRGDDDAWREYLEIRQRQGFTAIQFVATHWRGNHTDAFGTAACTMEHPIRVHPEFFQRIDRRVAMINEYGMIAAPILLWALQPEDIGRKLDEADAIRIAQYLVARYGGHQVVWLLGGDCDYARVGIDRWKRVGQAVFGERHYQPVGLHACGQSWPFEEFREETWLDMFGYQSGHGDVKSHLQFLVQGPPSQSGSHTPAKVVLNLEPNYELAYGYQHNTPFTSYHVRRACYWSTLVAPTAGVTYGHDAIWNWNAELGPSEGHGEWHSRGVPSYRVGLETEGLEHLVLLKRFFETLPWWTLQPAQDLLAEQPGADDPAVFIAAARTTDGSHRVLYTPVGAEIRLTNPTATRTRWFNPRNGTWSPAKLEDGVYKTPDPYDWLLVLE